MGFRCEQTSSTVLCSKSSAPIAAVAGWLLAGLVIAGAASAQTFHGRLTSSFYAWERAPSDTTDFNHLRFYQLGIFHLDGVADRRLSLHTYMRVHGDLADDLGELASWRLLNLYAQWKDVPRGYELRGGRMRIYAGAGNVTIDGGYARYRYPDWASVEGYVGVQPPLAGDFEVSDWEDRAYGGRLTLDRWSEVRVALSYARRERAPIRYEEPGDYTGRFLELPSEQEELYGADASWLMRPDARLYGRLEVDATQRRLKWGNTVLSWAPTGTPWNADFEYMHRAPSIYGNSLLSVFHYSAYDQVSARAGYRATPNTRLHGNLATTLYDSDTSYQFGIGVDHGLMFVNYSLRSGYGGDMNALIGGYGRPVRDWVHLRAQAGITGYEIDEDSQDEDNISFVLTLGSEFRPRRDLAIDVEVQNLSQDIYTQPSFAGYDYDLRGHVRVTYGFFTGRAPRATGVRTPNDAAEPGAPAGP